MSLPRKLWLCIAGALTAGSGCQQQSVVAPENITVELKRADRPEFRREYLATIEGGFTIKASFHYFIGSRFSSYAEIQQPGGKWILFDLANVADKIIDRDLVPKVERIARQIIAMDAEFCRNLPNEYIDSTGAHWVRVTP